jgi:hypothetical protein
VYPAYDSCCPFVALLGTSNWTVCRPGGSAAVPLTAVHVRTEVQLPCRYRCVIRALTMVVFGGL